MDKNEIKQVINSILERGNPKYTTPSGAFFELLRKYSQKEEIVKLSEMLIVYCEEFPEAKAFLSQRLPGILANNYFTVRKDLDYGKFIEWSMKTENWADGIKKLAFNPHKLKTEVDLIVDQANNHTN